MYICTIKLLVAHVGPTELIVYAKPGVQQAGFDPKTAKMSRDSAELPQDVKDALPTTPEVDRTSPN